MKQSKRHAAAAERVNRVIMDLKQFLPGKVRAYGAAHEIQPTIWRILLAPYRNGSVYQIPSHIVREIPRLTRCLDRIIRIVNAPDDGDVHGEHPWLDLAGDAIAGEATRRTYEDADKVMMGVGMPVISGAMALADKVLEQAYIEDANRDKVRAVREADGRCGYHGRGGVGLCQYKEGHEGDHRFYMGYEAPANPVPEDISDKVRGLHEGFDCAYPKCRQGARKGSSFCELHKDAMLSLPKLLCRKVAPDTVHQPTVGGCTLLDGHSGRWHEAPYGKDPDRTYRWDGTGAVEISPPKNFAPES